MATPHAELPINFAVTCQTCAVVIWQGSHVVEDDGQVLLNAYADVACPRPDCPHKTPAPACE
jgi:hypothetical protein